MINIIYTPRKQDKDELYVHVCGTAQIYCMTTITQLHCKEQCHLPVCFRLSQPFLCVISIVPIWHDSVTLYNLLDSTRECCVISCVIFGAPSACKALSTSLYVNLALVLAITGYCIRWTKERNSLQISLCTFQEYRSTI